MDLLQNILGGGQERQRFQDFAKRYDQGSPYDGIDDREALEHYQRVAPHLSQQQFQDAAQESFSRMSPQERLQYGQYMRQQLPQQGMNFPDMNGDGIDDRLQDPNFLAQMTGRVHQQQPNLLGQMLGGALGGGMMGGAGNMLGGMMGGGGGMGGAGGMLANPIAKAALAGIAATAVQRMMRGR